MDETTDIKLRELSIEAIRIGVDWGWLWLYRNGFAHRVPPEIREKIEGKKSTKEDEMEKEVNDYDF